MVPDAHVEEVVTGGTVQQVPQGEAMREELQEAVGDVGEQCWGDAPTPLTRSPHGALCATWLWVSPWLWWLGPYCAAVATRGGGGQPGPGEAGCSGVSDPALG